MNIEEQGFKILYVIVLYKCTISDSISYKTLLKDNVPEKDIFVYDNSPYKQTSEIQVGKYISDVSNSGLSVAYNTAADYASENGYEWLLLLDQDTTFPNGATQDYLAAIKNNPSIDLFAPQHKIKNNMFISPTKYHHFESKAQSKVLNGIVNFSDAAPINSGILVRLASFVKAGGYDNDVFLDFSDVRFIEKFSKRNKTFYVLPNVICQQDFSSEESDLGKTLIRYNLYLKCAKAYPKNNIYTRCVFFYITTKRTWQLLKHLMKVLLILNFYNIYIKDNK